MTSRQKIRFGMVALFIAGLQVAGFDRLQLFGLATLFVPLWLVVAIGGRLPATNATVAGFIIGLFVDLLSPALFGRYAFALAIVGAASAFAGSHLRSWGRNRGAIGSAVVVAVATIWLWGFSALVGEVFPLLSGQTIAGLALSSMVSILFVRPGGVLDRLCIAGTTDWEVTGDRSSEWVDRRAGLYSVSRPLDNDTLEAA